MNISYWGLSTVRSVISGYEYDVTESAVVSDILRPDRDFCSEKGYEVGPSTETMHMLYLFC